MQRLLESRLPGFDPGESELEARVLRWLLAAGLPRPESQFRVIAAGRCLRLDLAYPEHRLGLELDGWDAHGSRGAFDRDRERANEVALIGWRLCRFTSRTTRAAVVRVVSAALGSTS